MPRSHVPSNVNRIIQSLGSNQSGDELFDRHRASSFPRNPNIDTRRSLDPGHDSLAQDLPLHLFNRYYESQEYLNRRRSPYSRSPTPTTSSLDVLRARSPLSPTPIERPSTPNICDGEIYCSRESTPFSVGNYSGGSSSSSSHRRLGDEFFARLTSQPEEDYRSLDSRVLSHYLSTNEKKQSPVNRYLKSLSNTSASSASPLDSSVIRRSKTHDFGKGSAPSRFQDLRKSDTQQLDSTRDILWDKVNAADREKPFWPALEKSSELQRRTVGTFLLPERTSVSSRVSPSSLSMPETSASSTQRLSPGRTQYGHRKSPSRFGGKLDLTWDDLVKTIETTEPAKELSDVEEDISALVDVLERDGTNSEVLDLVKKTPSVTSLQKFSFDQGSIAEVTKLDPELDANKASGVEKPRKELNDEMGAKNILKLPKTRKEEVVDGGEQESVGRSDILKQEASTALATKGDENRSGANEPVQNEDMSGKRKTSDEKLSKSQKSAEHKTVTNKDEVTKVDKKPDGQSKNDAPGNRCPTEPESTQIKSEKDNKNSSNSEDKLSKVARTSKTKTEEWQTTETLGDEFQKLSALAGNQYLVVQESDENCNYVQRIANQDIRPRGSLSNSRSNRSDNSETARRDFRRPPAETRRKSENKQKNSSIDSSTIKTIIAVGIIVLLMALFQFLNRSARPPTSSKKLTTHCKILKPLWLKNFVVQRRL